MALSLIDEISRLTTPAPVFQDPEDDLEDDTIARLTEKGEDDEFTPLSSTKLRQRAAASVDDSDRRYSGKRTSRKKIETEDFKEDEEMESDDDSSISKSNDEEDDETGEESDVISAEEEDENDDESYEEDKEEEEDIQKFKSKLSLATQGSSQKEFSFVDDGDYSKYADDDENDEEDDENSDDDDDEEEDEGSDEGSVDEEEEDEDENQEGVSKFSKSTRDEEMQKGHAARQQLGLWDSLLEGRIKFQKAIALINQLPQPDTWQAFAKSGGDKFAKNASSVQSMLKDLVDKLAQLQTLLLLQNSETRCIITGENPPKGKNNDDDDEEITSESETEETETKTNKKMNMKAGMKRKLTVEEYPDFLAKRHLDFQEYRNSTIQKWFDKTRLSGGRMSSKSFSAFEQSALKQIEQILCDKERLVKRTQLKRSSYKVLGKHEPDDIGETNNDVSSNTADSNTKSYDAEIFDDSDFYHQQLRELIERKTSDVDDPVALSRQWLEIQRLRNKVKKQVDTKASKGRKLRYDVHAKLVNFMAPKDTFTWTDEARDDLFKSLFGKRFQTNSGS